MIKITFTTEEKRVLFEAQEKVENPRLRMKCWALYLKSMEMAHGKICEICQISTPTLIGYFKEYICGGISELCKNRYVGHPSELRKYSEKIKIALEESHPGTLKEVSAKIAEVTGGVRVSLPQIWEFIRALGFSTKKVGTIPGKANPQAQEDFKKKASNRVSKRQWKRNG